MNDKWMSVLQISKGRTLLEEEINGKANRQEHNGASPVPQLVKNLPAMQETWVRSLSWEDPLEKGKATHSSMLAWRIPWTV